MDWCRVGCERHLDGIQCDREQQELAAAAPASRLQDNTATACCRDWRYMSRQTDAVTEAHRQLLRQVFDSYDRGDGYLGTAQMSKCFSKFGARMTEAELSDLINECGGQVDFNEFVFLMTRKFSDCNPRSEIESAFRAMDKDGDGIISAADAAASFAEMGQDQLASPEFLKELLREMQV